MGRKMVTIRPANGLKTNLNPNQSNQVLACLVQSSTSIFEKPNEAALFTVEIKPTQIVGVFHPKELRCLTLNLLQQMVSNPF
jgi:hypothetical protein